MLLWCIAEMLPVCYYFHCRVWSTVLHFLLYCTRSYENDYFIPSCFATASRKVIFDPVMQLCDWLINY